MSETDMDLSGLIQTAYRLGATGVTAVSADDIVVDDRLADKCREPRCESYGLSKSCPPHVSGPPAFRKLLEKIHFAIFFKIDVPSEILFSCERREIFHLLHQTAAGIEKAAREMGLKSSQAYAGGSCKNIFCHAHSDCRVISEKGKCRNPQFARPSMSGFGINVAKLYETAGWTMTGIAHDSESNPTKMSSVCGLVVLF